MNSKRLATKYRTFVDTIESNGWVSPTVLLLLFSFGVFRNIHLPGLYWDAVNPDYLAAKILAGNQYINHFLPWEDFPFLGNYYHGAMHTYFGLFFFKLFGFSVFSLQIAHAIFGLGILLVCNKIIARITGSRVFSLLIVGVLALDPAFIFAFRTQTYITLSPLLFLLISFYLLLLVRDRINASGISGVSSALIILSGICAGWAFYGYFIYIFFVPAFLLILVHLSRKPGYSASKMILYWGAGYALGSVLYVVGYVRLWLTLGGVSEILKGVSSISITGNPIGFQDRPYLLFMNSLESLGGYFQYYAMFSDASPTTHGAMKLMVMVSIMLTAILIVAVRKRFYAPLGYFLLLIASFFAVSLYFAGRVGPHHMVLMLPLLYTALGVFLYQAGSGFSNGMIIPAKIIGSTALVSMVVFLVVLNLQQQNIFQKQLVETGGVKYYSDSMTLLAEEARHNPDPPYYVFGEWGFVGSFAFLTEGKVPYNPALDDWAIGRVLCSTDLAILFWGQSNPTVESFADTQGRVSIRKEYYQRDGAVSFTVLSVTDRSNCSLTDNPPGY